jgi:hypothetical protein
MLFSKQNVALVPKNTVWKKEEGAAVDSSAILPYLSSAGCLVRPDRQRSTTNSHQTVGKSNKLPKMSY